MAYDPDLPLDMLRAMVAGLDMVVLFHLYNRGEGQTAVDIAADLCENARENFYLPEEFYQDWQNVKDTDAFERVIFKWCKIFKRLRG